VRRVTMSWGLAGGCDELTHPPRLWVPLNGRIMGTIEKRVWFYFCDEKVC
jgi:hypothetical protein